MTHEDTRTSLYALIDGGPAGLFYGYIITIIGYFLVFASVAEMALM
jgi:choline transport protein